MSSWKINLDNQTATAKNGIDQTPIFSPFLEFIF